MKKEQEQKVERGYCKICKRQVNHITTLAGDSLSGDWLCMSCFFKQGFLYKDYDEYLKKNGLNISSILQERISNEK